jgi:surface protein
MNNLAFQIYGSTKSGIFQSTWKTDNAGVSSSTQIELPLLSGGTYNFWIDWGDGSTTNVTSYSQRTHTYASAGTYTLRATGTVGIWRFANGGDKLKILTVSSWGKLILGSNTFNGCSNLTLSGITDVPNLSTVTSLTNTFALCPLITTIGRLNEWNMSTITSMQGMFYISTSFNQYIGDWNVSNVTSMDTMFWATPFNNGYASGVAGSLNWNTVKVTTFSNMFAYNTGFNQDISAWNVNKVTSFGNMFLRCITFNNGNNTNVNPITLRSGIDGWDLNTTSNVALDGWMNSNGGPMIFNRNLNNWNTVKVINMRSMFENCGSFNNGYASGIANQLTWNTSACTNMSLMFYQAPAFNSNLGTGTTPWDVSKVTTFASMFNGATKFNNGDDSAPINNWNTSSATNMESMFDSCLIFNRNVGAWNVSNCLNFQTIFARCPVFNNGGSASIDDWRFKTSGNINMYAMFTNSSAFNQPLNSWNTTRVVNMSGMFGGASVFNQNVGAWDVSNCTVLSAMFYQAFAFNNGGSADINNWILNTNLAVNLNLYQMFFGASAFNQSLNNWNTSRVSNMGGIFWRASNFNNGLLPGIAGTMTWDTSNVTRMDNMFAENGAKFNCDISSWNVSKVTDFYQMFYFASAFNNGGSANINNWVLNTTSDVSMQSMFIGTSFNQNIGNWNVSKVTDFTNFMLDKTPATFSSTNLDAIYNGWIVNGVKPNINISFGTAKYTSAGTAGRLTLTSAPNNWIITDGGL